jgi:hypothetical protein
MIPVIPADKALLTADRLREVLRYSPENGEFVWRSKRRLHEGCTL